MPTTHRQTSTTGIECLAACRAGNLRGNSLKTFGATQLAMDPLDNCPIEFPDGGGDVSRNTHTPAVTHSQPTRADGARNTVAAELSRQKTGLPP